METAFLFKGMSTPDEELLRSYVMKKLDKFDRILADYPQDGVVLEIKGERFEKHNAYDVEFILKVPNETFTAKEASHFITKAVDRAKDRLDNQLTKYVAALARKHRTVKSRVKVKMREVAEIQDAF